MASNAPDTSFIHAVLRTCHKWSWKQHVLASCLSGHEPKCPSRVKRRNFHRNRGYAIMEMDRLDPAVFKKMFRLERPVFDELLDVITPHLVQCCDSKARNSSRSAISSKTRLAVTLRWLAGASHIDLCFAWGLAHSTFFSERGVLWPTVEAIDNAFEMGFPVNDLDRLEELSKGFSDHSGGILDGCVLAIDGFGVQTRCPFRNEVVAQKDYRFRKGGFAIIVIAGCDVDGRFITALANHSGSTNDIIAWNSSKLHKWLEIDCGLPSKYFFIGYEAFTNTNQFLSPWPGQSLDRYKRFL